MSMIAHFSFIPNGMVGGKDFHFKVSLSRYADLFQLQLAVSSGSFATAAQSIRDCLHPRVVVPLRFETLLLTRIFLPFFRVERTGVMRQWCRVESKFLIN